TDSRQLEGLGPRQLRELARLSIRAMRKPGVLGVLRDVAFINRWWLLLDLALFGWGWKIASSWLMASAAALAALPFVLALWNYRHGGRYDALLRAFSVGDWPRVRELARKLRPLAGRVADLGFELDLRVAW